MNFDSGPQERIRIVFLIRSLFFGGAERQLLSLCSGINKEIFEPIVLCFFNGGDLEPEFSNAGIPVISLKKSGRWDVLPFLIRLINQISIQKPDILHSYLPMSNILAVLMRIFFPEIRIVFGVRSSLLDLSNFDLLTRIVYRIEALVSKYADLIIVNSRSSMIRQIRNGFPAERIRIIYNGIATDRYYPNPDERKNIRDRLGITEKHQLVGLVGRFDMVKDHPTFIKAAAKVAGLIREARFLIVGDGDPVYKRSLEALSESLEISKRIFWLEGQKNIRAVYNSMDVYCSASITESFSNVIAEAMACGVPCVVTDVGESAFIVGEFGEVVPAGDADAMAEGLRKKLSLPHAAQLSLGTGCRERIIENFRIERMVLQTEKALINLVKGKMIK